MEQRDIGRRIQMLFHSLGLACLGGSIFLQILVFSDILQRGYFMAVERNPVILSFEISLTAFTLIYFVYTYQRFLRSTSIAREEGPTVKEFSVITGKLKSIIIPFRAIFRFFQYAIGCILLLSGCVSEEAGQAINYGWIECDYF